MSDAEKQAIFFQMLGRYPGPADMVHMAGLTTVDEVMKHIEGSAEYRNRHGKEHPVHYNGTPISKDAARSYTRVAFLKYVGYPGSHINDEAHAIAMADGDFEDANGGGLWKNAQGLDKYGGNFAQVLAEHEPRIRQRAGID